MGYLHFQPLFTEDLGEPFIVLHSVAHVQAGTHTLEVLLLRVVKDTQETAGSGYSVTLEWITVTNAAGQGVGKKLKSVWLPCSFQRLAAILGGQCPRRHVFPAILFQSGHLGHIRGSFCQISQQNKL